MDYLAFLYFLLCLPMHSSFCFNESQVFSYIKRKLLSLFASFLRKQTDWSVACPSQVFRKLAPEQYEVWTFIFNFLHRRRAQAKFGHTSMESKACLLTGDTPSPAFNLSFTHWIDFQVIIVVSVIISVI